MNSCSKNFSKSSCSATVLVPVPESPECCDGDGMIEDEVPDEQIKESSHQSSKSTKLEKVKGSNWTDIETSIFIDLYMEKRIIQLMDGKRYKHIDIYKSLEPYMKEMGFIKTGAQMKTKLKHLKEVYFKCKRNNRISGADRMTFPFFDAMDQLLSGRPSVKAITNQGIDSSSSSQASSQDANIQKLSVDEAANLENSLADNVDIEIIEESELKKGNIKSNKKTSGRYTQVKLAQNFAEVFAKCQAQQMQGVIEKQMEMFNDSIQEKEMLQKDHEHQMLNNFMIGMQAVQRGNNFQPYPHSPFSSTPISFNSTIPFINLCGFGPPSSPSTSSSPSICTTPSSQTSTPMPSPPSTSSFEILQI